MKPLYVVRLNDVGYYSKDHHWARPQSKEKATRLSHKEAHRRCSQLHRLGYPSTVEAFS